MKGTCSYARHDEVQKMRHMILLRVAGGITVSLICVKNGSNNTSGAVTVVLSTPIAQQFLFVCFSVYISPLQIRHKCMGMKAPVTAVLGSEV